MAEEEEGGEGEKRWWLRGVGRMSGYFSFWAFGVGVGVWSSDGWAWVYIRYRIIGWAGRLGLVVHVDVWCGHGMVVYFITITLFSNVDFSATVFARRRNFQVLIPRYQSYSFFTLVSHDSVFACLLT